MNNKFDYLKTPEKIQEAERMERSYNSYYFNCDDWSIDDIYFKLKLTYNFPHDPHPSILTDDEFEAVWDTIISI